MRRCVISLVLLLSLAPALAADKPSILFLFNDDQRADTIAALGNPVIRTPNLDRLCRQGMAFTRAYMQGGFNGATCVPSRAMLLSGQSLFHVDEKLLRHQTWPAAFGRAGYTTFATGKWHNGAESLPLSFQLARSIFSGGMADPLKAPLSDMENGKLTEPKPSAKHACAVFADEAVRFLQEHEGGPFFCYVAFDGPHDPHIVPARLPGALHARPTAPATQLPAAASLRQRRDDRPGRDAPAASAQPEAVAGDDRRLLPLHLVPRHADRPHSRCAGGLAVRREHLSSCLPRTPGVARGSHGLIGKQNLYEHSVRVPLIIAGPGIPAGTQTAAMCYLYDVLPTLGKLCGITNPDPSEAREFSATLHDPNRPARAELVFAYRDVQRAIRDDRWKLIRYPQIDKTQLFDLQDDPFERNDLAGESKSAERSRT